MGTLSALQGLYCQILQLVLETGETQRTPAGSSVSEAYSTPLRQGARLAAAELERPDINSECLQPGPLSAAVGPLGVSVLEQAGRGAWCPTGRTDISPSTHPDPSHPTVSQLYTC